MGHGNSLPQPSSKEKKLASWSRLLLTCLQSQGMPAEVGVTTERFVVTSRVYSRSSKICVYFLTKKLFNGSVSEAYNMGK